MVWSTEPRAIIEVKRWAEDYSDDIARLIKLAQKISCLEFSVLATCLFQKVSKDNKAEDILRERIETIRLNIQNDAKRNNLRIHQEPGSLRIEPLIIPIDDERKRRQKWVWCPVCFVIYDKLKRR